MHHTVTTIQAALADSCIDRSDVEVLLTGILHRDRSWIIAHPEHVLTAEEEARWDSWKARRRQGEPVAYIVGEKEFFGRMFASTRGVLIPRPSTEELVLAALAFLEHPSDTLCFADSDIVIYGKTFQNRHFGNIATVVDTGTGSGCIAVTLACERKNLTIIATDTSGHALQTAKANAVRHGVENRIQFRQGNLLEPVRDLSEPFVIVSNPPYIPSGEILPEEVFDFEPREALFAGKEGLDVLLPLVGGAQLHPWCAGFLVECREDQVGRLKV